MRIAWPTYVTPDEQALVLEGAFLSKFAYFGQADVDAYATSTAPLVLLEKPVRVEAPFDAQAVVFRYASAYHPRLLAVGVSGSKSIEDYVCNVPVLPTVSALFPSGAQVRLHTGFAEQAQALQPLLEAAVVAELDSGEPVFFVGHSLGSSVAGILAAHYAARYPKQVFYVGFGNPRTGNESFGRALVDRAALALNVQNCRDPICGLIPPGLYVHCGDDVCIGDTTEWPNVLFGLDHLTMHYITNLQAGGDVMQSHPLLAVRDAVIGAVRSLLASDGLIGMLMGG